MLSFDERIFELHDDIVFGTVRKAFVSNGLTPSHAQLFKAVEYYRNHADEITQDQLRNVLPEILVDI